MSVQFGEVRVMRVSDCADEGDADCVDEWDADCADEGDADCATMR